MEVPEGPIVLSANVVVKDVTQQAIRSSTSILVHPSDLYVGIRNQIAYSNVGDVIPIQFAIIETKSSAPVGNVPILLRIEKTDMTYDPKTYKYVTKVVSSIAVTLNSTSSKQNPVEYAFKPTEGGTYKIYAEVEDSKGFKNSSSVSLWVAGGNSFFSSTRVKNAPETLNLLANKESYQPGETAKLMVVSPFNKAYGNYYLVYDTYGYFLGHRGAV